MCHCFRLQYAVHGERLTTIESSAVGVDSLEMHTVTGTALNRGLSLGMDSPNRFKAVAHAGQREAMENSPEKPD